MQKEPEESRHLEPVEDTQQLEKDHGYTEEEIENFRCIFEMFDKDNSNFIDITDLQAIMRSLNRDPAEANELVKSLDTNSDEKVSFDEFLMLMRHLETRMSFGMPNEEGGETKDGAL